MSNVLRTEPARLYGYGLVAFAVLGLVLAAVITGDWSTVTPLLVGIVIAGPAATEATRAAVVSPATNEAEVSAALDATPDSFTKHEVVPQTPGVADHAADEQ